MSVSWDASELNALAADLGRAGHETTRKAQMVVRKSGLDAEAIMEDEVPVDTGAMKNSTGVDFAPDSLSAEVGPTVSYAPFVAFGTRYRAPDPFDLRTMQRVGPGFESAMAEIGGEIL